MAQDETPPTPEATDEQEQVPEPPETPGVVEEAPVEAAPEEARAAVDAAPEEVGEAEEVKQEQLAEEVFAGEPPAPEPVAAAEQPAAPVEQEDSDANKNWYIIHTYSGFEQKVADSLRGRSQAFGFADKIGQILIPTEEVVELRSGKKITSKRLLYPGYVLVQMEMNDQLWHEVKNTPRVTGFVGGGNTPVPLSADEVNSILFRQATAAERPGPKMTFAENWRG